MAESAQLSALPAADHKRRKVEADAGHVKAERVKGLVTDKAKANYLSGQLRLRLQYAKLKVEHGWQRQTLSEVENLYFRHTHLTRPYPVISPGGRRNGRTLSSNSFSFTLTQQENLPSFSSSQTVNGSILHLGASGSAGTSTTLRSTASSSSLSAESSVVLSLPATPTLTHNRIPTPLAPFVGSSKAMTRYPISRTDSCATVVMESIPSLHQTHSAALHHPKTHQNPVSSQTASSASTSTTPSSSQTCASNNAFHEPFDPMQPTELVDSQLAALRSIITASTSIPLPPPVPAASPAPPTSTPGTASPGMGGGLTYDAFWSTHGSGTSSYRNMRAGQPVGRPAVGVPLQAHASAPAVMASLVGDGGPIMGPGTAR
ncbi:hypothetical protein V8D89_001997 [Ganoderma adspersum]